MPTSHVLTAAVLAAALLLGRVGSAAPIPPASAPDADEPCFIFARDTVSVRIGQESCRHAARRLREVLGVSVPMGALILFPSNEWSAQHPDSALVPAGAAWVERWMDVGVFALRPTLKDTSVAKRVAALRSMLPHETAHSMVGAIYFPGTGGRDANGYGTPLPDWVDDGLAQLAEFAEEYPHKAAWLAGSWERRIPLERFVSDPHPVWRERARFMARVRGDRSVPPADPTVPPGHIWYGQSFVFTLFMVEQCGPGFHAFVAALARAPRRWPAVPCAAASPAALQPTFEQWFERRYLGRT